ncbi:hypothetical protein [Streptomyces profundus]|uniref:DODA-type extradiol aromatic ring-opening family dioxygenase n=1 Tax=Streptomyces profundus TaxID=2867410 RepID=UPI001D1632BD|nr:hypothetical protein [Streptomyces sp. MA3_2.13]UED83246.1 hypothetical protein K4G22_02735 [Streptomyces sp. MA3_2.13]
MAEIVLGLGTSHGPQLKTTPEQWDERAVFDRASRTLVHRGEDHSWDSLRQTREDFSRGNAAPAREAAYAASQRALDRLAELTERARPDVVVIVSSDHKEIFGDELLAPFAVYWGDSVAHVPFSREDLERMAPGLARAAVHDVPAEPIVRPCHPELAGRLLEQAAADGFDLAASRTLPAGRYRNHGLPHGWGYIYQRIVGEGSAVPLLPVFVNTFWEPNPPSAPRCYAFGQTLARAIAGLPGGLRVAVVASGGLSHFVIEEDLDRAFLTALAEGDADHLRSLPAAVLRSGTSELRSWITVAGALADSPLTPELVDYQPCYRTEAGTGTAMGFFAWHTP